MLIKKIRFIFLFLLIFGFLTLPAISQEISLEVKVDKSKVSMSDKLKLSFTFRNVKTPPAYSLSGIDGFSSRYIGPSTVVSVVNGQMQSSVTQNYLLTPLGKGVFTIGPFFVNIKGKTYTSNSLKVEVTESLSQDSVPEDIPANIQESLQEKIFAVMKVDKIKTYVNEIIPVNIKLYLDNRLDIQDIQYPQIKHEGFFLGEYQLPKQYGIIVRGSPYNVVEFNTTIAALSAGEFNFGPARIQCNMSVRRKSRSGMFGSFDEFFQDDVFENFFGRHQTYPIAVETEKKTIGILPLPVEGRPEGFEGAIGNFTLKVDVEPKEVKVGDPVNLKMIIEGQGNLSTVTMPQIASLKEFKTYEPQSETKDNSKVFEQILIPRTENITVIPEIKFSFFNPGKDSYQEIIKEPIAIKVLPSDSKSNPLVLEYDSPDSVSAREVLGKDIAYIKEHPGKLKTKQTSHLYSHKGFLLLQLLPVCLLLGVIAVYKKSERLRTDVKYARSLRASRQARRHLFEIQGLLKQGKTGDFYDAVFKFLQEYLGDKFHLPKGITVDVVDTVLKPKGISDSVLGKVKDVFKECDMARFAPTDFTKKQMEEALKGIGEIVDYFERNKV
ncbi:MAG: BatD family protein [Candidatus Omnitrophica bacterium]|nr:BatD family protein [Candidatus Omnitrophota bacterium]MDD5430144.1 BatD family protein [Candidatus Omnitrophota bacterium]